MASRYNYSGWRNFSLEEDKMFKNINHDEVISLASEIEILKGQVVSKTLVQNSSVNVTLFGLDTNEEISSHQSNGDALVTILSGKAKITVDGKEFIVEEGESIIMSAKKPHALWAVEPFKMILTVVF